MISFQMHGVPFGYLYYVETSAVNFSDHSFGSQLSCISSDSRLSTQVLVAQFFLQHPIPARAGKVGDSTGGTSSIPNI